jgi:hypothetical protein
MDAAGGWLYVSDYGQGAFRSSDRGKTWTPVNAGLPEPWWIFSLAIDPERPKTLLATNSVGIYRSLTAAKAGSTPVGPYRQWRLRAVVPPPLGGGWQGAGEARRGGFFSSRLPHGILTPSLEPPFSTTEGSLGSGDRPEAR